MPYNNLAKYYDALNYDVDYKQWADYLDKIIKKFYISSDISILDFACGTGTITSLLYNYGYKICGLDKSKMMIEIAKRKNKKINFIPLEIRKYQPDRKFNVVISTFDSINAITNENELFTIFKQIYSMLYSGGIFVFDVNTEYGFKAIGDEFTYTKENSEIFSVWTLEYEERERIARLFLTVFERMEDSNYLRNDYVLNERVFPIKFLKSILKKSGFKNITILDHLTMNKYNKNSFRVDFIAIKKE